MGKGIKFSKFKSTVAGGEILKDNYGPPNIDPKGVKKKKKKR